MCLLLPLVVMLPPGKQSNTATAYCLAVTAAGTTSLLCCCRRYRLSNNPPPDAAAAAVLQSINASEADPELRADLMADALLAPTLGKQCIRIQVMFTFL